MTAVRMHNPFAAFLFLLVFLTPLLAAAPGHAQESPSADDLKALVETIEDPGARARLLTQLRALVEAREGARPAGPSRGFVESLLDGVAAKIGETTGEIVAAAGAFDSAPRIADWLAAQVSEPARRAAWAELLGRVLAAVLVGLLAEWATRGLLRRSRTRIEERREESILLRLPLLALRTLIDLLPLVAFGVAAYALLPLFRPDDRDRDVIVLVLYTYLLARGSIALAHTALAPTAPGLRALPLGEEAANYLFVWVRRFAFVAIIGSFTVEAARLFGLPPGGHGLAAKFLGLLLAAMTVIFILQNRRAVASVLGGDAGDSAGVRTLRNRFADIWHVLAVIYVLVACLIWMLEIEGGFEFVLRATVLTIVIAAAAAILHMGVTRALARAFAIRAEVRERFPTLEARANRYLPLLHWVVRIVIWGAAALAVLEAWGVDSFAWLTGTVGQRIVTSALSIGLVLALAAAVWEGVSSSIERYLGEVGTDGSPIERSTRARTLLPLLRNALFAVLAVMVGLIVLSEVGINIGPLLAGAGVVGLALGIGSQKLVQDVITGALILVEDAVSVGDVVMVAGKSGVVEAVTIRTLRLRDLSGSVHTIPFSSVDTVSNMTKLFSFYVFEVGIAYREKVDDVMAVLTELGAEMQKDATFGPLILEPLDILGVDSFGDSAVIIKARVKTRPIKQWMVGREFNRRMKNRFDELGIEIPFPHRTLYFGVDRDGNAPPAFVRMADRAGGAQAGSEAARPPRPAEAPEPSISGGEAGDSAAAKSADPSEDDRSGGR